MSDFLLAVISFVIILGPLIIIHELGHFIACRMVGITVLEFGLGIPPRAAKLFERNGTEFTLNWLPVGGFVRPLGEDFVRPVGPEATEADKQRYAQYQAELTALGRKTPGKIKSVMEATPIQRLFFLVAGSGMNFIGAIVILFIAGLLGVPTPAPVIGANAPGSPADQVGLKFGDILLAVNDTPVLNAEAANEALKIAAEVKDGARKPVNLTIVRAGQETVITVPPLAADAPGFDAGGVMIVGTVRGSPAEPIFKVADVIIRIDSRKMSATKPVQDYIRARAGTPIKVTVIRDNKQEVFEVTPRLNSEQQGEIGVSIQPVAFDLTYGMAVVDSTNAKLEALSPGESLSFSVSQTGDILRRLILFPVDLIRGVLPIQDARPISIVGITQIGGEALSLSIEQRHPFPLLNFAALISIALGFTNLLPIPGLDGGRILFVLVEILRGKPMAPEREGAIHLIGLLIILGLFAILVVNDIVNPIGSVLR
jgi:regulator of sigma E protease